MIQKPKRPRRPAHEAPASVLQPDSEQAMPRPERVGELLLAWYAHHRRDLPWRAHSDPYAIWVSEVMLQQTQVATVKPYYQRWLKSFPTLRALAAASEDDVLHHWQGLGYYSRARALHAGAKEVVARGGELPASALELRSLPGIGPYTAGAIASIAFGLDEPLVDGNVIRVLTRLFAISGDPKKSAVSKRLWELARTLLPPGKAGDFNQALMELGAIRCTPRKPLCEQCPLKDQCVARRLDLVERFPQLPPRAKPTSVEHVAVLARRGERVVVSRLPADAPRWAGMWVFPTLELASGQAPDAGARQALLDFTGLECTDIHPLHSVQHSVTRYRINLTLWQCSNLRGRGRAGSRSAEIRWLSAENLVDLAMPAAQRRLAAWLGTANGAP